MADIRDLVEKWDGHTGNEVEKFLKQELGKRQESLRLGAGLGWDEGKLAVRYGRGLNFYSDGTMGVNVGRGLKIESCQVVVDDSIMTEVGKISGKQDRLSVSNGLKLANSVLKLRLSTSCSDINTSGLWYDDHGGLMVAAGTGLGIDRKNDGRLYIRCGPGITCNTDNDLTISYGSGLDVLDGKVVLHEDIYGRLDNAEGGIGRCRDAITNLQTAVGGKQDKLTLATGLEWGKTNMIQVKMNAPLNYDNCGRLMLNYDSTLTVSNNKLGVDLYGVMDSGGGLFIKNNGLAVNVGRGLKIDSCQVVVDYGTGMSENNNKIYVDTSKIAGSGIDLDSAYKTLTIGTKAAKELAGTGLAADGPKIKVKYGSGLTTNSCGNLIVDAANLTVGNADKLGGVSSGSYPRKALLYVRGDYQYFVVLLCKYGAGLTLTRHRLSGRIYSEGEGFGRYVAADVDIFVCDWNGGMDKYLRFDSYGVNEMDLITCNYGGVKYLAIRIRGTQAKTVYFEGTSTNMLLTPIKYYTSNTNTVNNAEIHGSMAVVSASQPSSNGNKYALVTDTVARATADAKGNNIADTYAKHFWPGQGMNLSNDSVLSLPNLTASVVNGAVDGVKNNNQRVLNLSCGTIQIKLSTGLAIDDNGYLYVQDKYVTK